MVEMELSGQYGTLAISIVHCVSDWWQRVGNRPTQYPHQYLSMFGVDITADLPASPVECNEPPGAG